MKRTLHVGNMLRDACSLLKALRLPFIALILPLAQVLALPGLDSGGPEIPSITGSTSVVSPGDIIFNEIMQNPNAVSDSDGEWFELYNTTSASIDINGWRIADAGSDMHLIDNGGPLEIPSGGYLVLGINADPATNGGVAVDYAYGSGLTLGNGDDELILFTPDSVEVDRVEWDGGPLFPDPTGASMALQAVGDDNNDGANWCVSMAAYGDGDLGTPGAANDCLAPTTVTLLVTEIFSGQAGTDLTADWFEIKNTGTEAWVAGQSPGLYYDDDSADPAAAVPIEGLTEIQPGKAAIVLVTGNPDDITQFTSVWSAVISLTGVSVGYADGAGLGGSDAVTLWLGDPNATTPVDTASYPDTAPYDGRSYDVELQAFSEVGNANGAVQTIALGGDNMDVPNIGSPGNGLAIPSFTGLAITEIFSGQAGADLTADWFEIKNTGTEAWVAGQSPGLYYDDDSADPAAAVPIEGLTEIQPGKAAIVLVTGNPDDITQFTSVWSAVISLTGVSVGYADGAGLGGSDAVTLWLGDPNTTTPVDTASYPDTAPYDGRSYDVELQAFSEVGNANGAVQTIALGGDNMDVPNIGSPGNGLAIPSITGLAITEIFSGQAGADLTADWFEIKNTGTEAWVAGQSPGLYYDDDSADPAAAVPIEGLTGLQPGETAIVLITSNPDDVDQFISVWSPVANLENIEVGYVDGAGLGGGGDAVTLWLGEPAAYLPVDMASYPDTAPSDGQSYDVELQAFSEVGNANGAVQTIALGGDNNDVPNIGSPGNQGPATSLAGLPMAGRLSVAPNPSNGLANVLLDGAGMVETVQVYNPSGKLLLYRQVNANGLFTLDLSALPASVYYLRVQGEKGIAVERIVKQ